MWNVLQGKNIVEKLLSRLNFRHYCLANWLYENHVSMICITKLKHIFVFIAKLPSIIFDDLTCSHENDLFTKSKVNIFQLHRFDDGCVDVCVCCWFFRVRLKYGISFANSIWRKYENHTSIIWHYDSES